MTGHRCFDSLAESWGSLYQHVAQGAEEIRELLFGPVQDILGEEAAAGAQLFNLDFRGRSQYAPHFFELAGQQAAENGVDVPRCVEVAGLAKLRGVQGVVAEVLVVEGP